MFGNGFYNPYMYQPYYQTARMARNMGGLAGTGGFNRAGSVLANSSMKGSVGNTLGSGLSGLFSKFSFSGFLNGASKTLNVVNQAIPIFYQVRPMINNAKTMFRIMGAVKNDDYSKKNIVREVKSNKQSPAITSDINEQRATKNMVVRNDEYISSSDDAENPVFFI